MNRTQRQHLTDAQFSDLLAGVPLPPPAAHHLAGCAHCGAELEDVRASLACFSHATGRWAQSVAPARVPVPSRWVLSLAGWPTLTTGAAVTALTGLLMFHFGPASRPTAAREPVPTTAMAVPSKTELADDNSLMLSIDEELTTRARPAVSAADLRDRDSASPRAAAAVVD